MDKPTVIDFFCGGGGFSEGFRQQGFNIIRGVDSWKAAIDTFEYNFGEGLGLQMNILEFEDVSKIEELPDTHVIIGSPPCVSFSLSNKSGKADKSLGIRLIEAYLRIIAIKKHKPKSILKAWFMENVKGSINHIPDYYTFSDLRLTKWANKYKIKPSQVAITIKGNYRYLDSADFGSPQHRKRAIAGEIVKVGAFVDPEKRYCDAKRCETQDANGKESHLTLGYIKRSFPKPNEKLNDELITDPLYKNIKIPMDQLTDHFYDTGLYISQWQSSMDLKLNHPYMGRMSFPENEDKPSRTVTATHIGTSREALIYKSEYNRSGDGEYRTPTVREAATLMSFPITYQFVGSEGTKWKMIGNAVCPSVSRALAEVVRKYMGLNCVKVPLPRITKNRTISNLNTFKEQSFNNPPVKKKGAKFRKHPFKDGNITVTLSNYDIVGKEKVAGKWRTSVQYGNGNGFPHKVYRDGFYKFLEETIATFENGLNFLEIINNGFSGKIADAQILQQMHEEQRSINGYLEPIKLIGEVTKVINSIKFDIPYVESNKYLKGKENIPKKQILALYAINRISSLANGKN